MSSSTTIKIDLNAELSDFEEEGGGGGNNGDLLLLFKSTPVTKPLHARKRRKKAGGKVVVVPDPKPPIRSWRIHVPSRQEIKKDPRQDLLTT